MTRSSSVVVRKLSTGEFLRIEPPRAHRRKGRSTPEYKKLYKGKTRDETLMFRALDKLYPDMRHWDHHRPKWLKNPMTSKNLELDRYYPRLKLAFEYNGRHHNNQYQIYKDSVKQKACFVKGIALVVVSSRHRLPTTDLQLLIDEAKSRLEEKRSV